MEMETAGDRNKHWAHQKCKERPSRDFLIFTAGNPPEGQQ
jgi:hypothetical protein